MGAMVEVVGNEDLELFGVVEGEVCMVLDEFFYNGEGWLKLRTEQGRVFESPDCFWEFQ